MQELLVVGLLKNLDKALQEVHHSNRNAIYKNGKWDQNEITPETINGAPNPEHLNPKKQATHDVQIKNGVKRTNAATGENNQAWTNEPNAPDEIETSYNDTDSWKSNQVLSGEVSQNNNSQERNMFWKTVKSGFSKVAKGAIDLQLKKLDILTPGGSGSGGQEPVSYTHLTLPTKA